MKYLLSVAVLLSISIASEEVKDPFENINRATFEFNENLIHLFSNLLHKLIQNFHPE